jgi:predicted glycogen debranching enzyme
MDRERARRKPSSTELIPALERASSQFLAERNQQAIVIAGYHWFTDWGRDTLISLAGLTLDMRRPYRARRTLSAYAPPLQGMLPNRTPDGVDKPEYNSIDATLWFVEALRAYFASTGDADFIREWIEDLKNIVSWRERGTMYGVRVDSDGLLMGGEPGVQLTWMDAKVNGRVITPRDGKPVEIQALWYNALCVIADFSDKFGDGGFASHCRDLAKRARDSFERQFWNEDAGCLFDVVRGSEGDASIRPNQIVALSLPYRILEDNARGARILDLVKRDLLTPFGLRTLSPRDLQYRGRYGGSPESRDSAYHQGTVWPWLLGPYVSALFAVHGNNDATMAEARRILDPFRGHLLEAGVGQISEVFDGDPPHAPGGCIAQAWSVGQLLHIARQAGIDS